jgi:CubicO group peptidase (beta-lactamase class C family)
VTAVPPEVPLPPLPGQPEGVAWPTHAWPVGDAPAGVALAPLLDEVLDADGPLASTHAVLVVHRGRIVAEHYAGGVEQWDAEPLPVAPDVPLLSWSMAKSMLHATVGILVGEGRLSPGARAPVPEWSDPDDPRHAITLDQLLEMRDGLEWTEDYVEAHGSDVIHMLFGEGRDDMAAFAAARPLAAVPGTRFNYSSGTSNIVARVVASEVGPGDPYAAFLRTHLFERIGMRTATATFDPAGTWIGSSYVHAVARDFARFGLLYLRGGVWDGEPVLPVGWVDHGRRPRSVDPDDATLYGAHWWAVGDEHGSFWASGYEGQMILLCPALDLVVVRLGKMPQERGPLLRAWRDRVIAAFAAAG